MDFTPLVEEDIPFLIGVRNECRHWLHNNSLFTVEECLTWFRQCRPCFFVIWWRDTKIGYFRTSSFSDGIIMVGADLAREYRGKGLAFAAYKEFIPFISERLGVRCFRLEVLATNSRAIKLYQRLGFFEINRVENAIERDGKSLGNIEMELRVDDIGKWLSSI